MLLDPVNEDSFSSSFEAGDIEVEELFRSKALVFSRIVEPDDARFVLHIRHQKTSIAAGLTCFYMVR